MKKTFSRILFSFLLLCVAAAAVVLALLNEREAPRIELVSPIEFLAIEQTIPFVVRDDKSGIRAVSVTVEQDGRRYTILDRSWPRRGWFSHGGENVYNQTVTVKSNELGLRDGRADLIVTARDFSLWNFMAGNVSTLRRPVIVDTSRPKVRLLDAPRSIAAGGSGMVRYRVNEPLAAHGVVLNGLFHPGVPVRPEDDRTLAAMLALPYDAERVKECYLTATDRAGNTVRVPFSLKVRPRRPRYDRITVSDRFLAGKLPEFAGMIDLPEGAPLDQYLYLNREERRKNNEKIRSITSVATPKRFWNGPMKRLPRSSRRAGFADRRSYFYQGRLIDKQVHLGIDLASVRQAPVPAAAAGTVVFADYLGIYGNAVILDHGWGVFSLYSHLSRMDVAKGEEVARGDILGRTGTTGMVGGDHLHFSVLVGGVFVDPVEWWDGRWLELNILQYLKPE